MERADDLDKCLKPRAVLTEDQVIEIFRISLVKRSPEIANFTATSVARKFGVSEKTVRDIWTGRTWYDETLPLDPHRQPKIRAKTGRPLGCKDRAPRKPRAIGNIDENSTEAAEQERSAMHAQAPSENLSENSLDSRQSCCRLVEVSKKDKTHRSRDQTKHFKSGAAAHGDPLRDSLLLCSRADVVHSNFRPQYQNAEGILQQQTSLQFTTEGHWQGSDRSAAANTKCDFSVVVSQHGPITSNSTDGMRNNQAHFAHGQANGTSAPNPHNNWPSITPLPHGLDSDPEALQHLWGCADSESSVKRRRAEQHPLQTAAPAPPTAGMSPLSPTLPALALNRPLLLPHLYPPVPEAPAASGEGAHGDGRLGSGRLLWPQPAASPLQPPPKVQEPPPQPPRHVLHFHAAERGQIHDDGVQQP